MPETINGWVGFDLDATTAFYTEFEGIDIIGDPIPRTIERINRYLEAGVEVRILTARVATTHGADADKARSAIEAWCEKYIGKKLPVTAEKDSEMLFGFDDRMISIVPNSGEIARPHEFGSIQVDIPQPWANQVRKYTVATIADEDLDEFEGFETQPHVTIKYGLLGMVTDDDVAQALSSSGLDTITLQIGKLSVFPSPDGVKPDVLKADIDSADLVSLNRLFRDKLPHIDTFPTYHAHMTLAYLKPGTGEQYAGDWPLQGIEIKVDRIRFNSIMGVGTVIPLDLTVPILMKGLDLQGVQKEHSVEYLKAALEKARAHLPDWLWKQIHAMAFPSAGGKARWRQPESVEGGGAAVEKEGAMAELRGPCGNLCATCEKRDICEEHEKLKAEKGEPTAADVHVAAPQEPPRAARRRRARLHTGSLEGVAQWVGKAWPVTVSNGADDDEGESAGSLQHLAVAVRKVHLRSPVSQALLERSDGEALWLSNSITANALVVSSDNVQKSSQRPGDARYVYTLGLRDERGNTIEVARSRPSGLVLKVGSTVEIDATDVDSGRLTNVRVRAGTNSDPDTVAKVEEAIANKRELRLIVPSAGPKVAKVAFVGASPSKIDGARGEPFVAAVGETLNREYLEPLGLERSDVLLTNAVPVLLLDGEGNAREPGPEEVEEWREWVTSEIEKHQPAIVVALGQTAKAALSGQADFVLPHPMAIRRFGDSGELTRKLRQVRRAIDERVFKAESESDPKRAAELLYLRRMKADNLETGEYTVTDIGKTRRGHLVCVKDGWGERYYGVANGRVHQWATKMADVRAFSCAPEVGLTKAKVKEIGWSDKAWEKALTDWGNQESVVSKEYTATILKANTEKQIVYGIVLEPDTIDSQNDTITADEIERTAHNFLVESRVIGDQHRTKAKCEVVESYLTPIDMTLGGQTVKRGTWVIGVHVSDPKLWAGIKAGQYTGFSVGGVALRETVR